MITDMEIGKQSSDERPLSEDEILISTGDKYTLISISVLKRVLDSEMPSAYRLEFLEWLDRYAKEWGSEAITAVNPMCDEGYEIVREAMKLGAHKALDIYAERKVFNAFVALNPSLLAAIELRSKFKYGHADG